MNNSSQKTRVLYVITKSNFGGAQKYVYDLATSLPKDSFDVAVALGGNGILIPKLEEAGVRVVPIPSLARDVNPLGDLKTFFNLIKIFRVERPHIVHLNSSKIGIMGGVAARLTRIPKIIFTAHGWAFNENRAWVSRLIIKFLSWVTILIAHTTIAVSDSIARDMRWVGARRKMVTIKNGIHKGDTLPQIQAREFLNTLSPAKIPAGAFVFGTIAELHPSKGLSFAVQAISLMSQENPNIHYVILGSGQDHATLAALIDDLGLTDRVHLLGFVDNASQYIKAFDCFILPSTTEALGLVLLEAGNAGIPVVATNIGGIPEVIEDQRTGILVPARNPKALALALFQILESTTTRVGLGNALHQRVLSSFSFEITLRKTIGLYNKK